MTDTAFPAGFLWGAATSAYQIEGSPLADGAGVSNWHRFSHTPGRVKDGDTGDVACDHYRRFEEDVALMKSLGLQTYRFSLAWSRILPDGTGRPNPKGIAFYSRLLDALHAAGIEPLVTLFHWDLPAALDDRGGWLNPQSPEWFAAYARVCFEAFDARVPRWATLNEPWVVVDAGFMHGVHAPGHASPYEAAIAAHHLLLAHGAAVETYRRVGRHAIGLVVNLEPKDAETDSADDREATRRADVYFNRQYLDPVFFGRYPEELPEMYGAWWPHGAAPDLGRARQPIDFLGINYYPRGVMRRDDRVWVERAARVRQKGAPHTETGWEVHAASFARVLAWVKDRYADVPLWVTENGAAFADPPSAGPDGIDDPLRVEYLRDHLRAAHAAIAQGVDLRGYCVWSLLDNFEWSQGYSKRFGIVHVDFATQRRTPKRSASFYREVVASNGASLG